MYVCRAREKSSLANQGIIILGELIADLKQSVFENQIVTAYRSVHCLTILQMS